MTDALTRHAGFEPVVFLIVGFLTLCSIERPLRPWFLGVVGIKYGPVGVLDPVLAAGAMVTDDTELLCDKICGCGVTGEFIVPVEILEPDDSR